MAKLEAENSEFNAKWSKLKAENEELLVWKQSAIRHISADTEWRERLDATLLGFDPKYLGMYHLQAAVDVVARAKKAEAEILELRNQLDARANAQTEPPK